MIDHAAFPVSVEWTGGKEGRAESSDGLPPLAVASPPEFGGPAGVWTPEHLFGLAVGSCLMTTFLAVAELSKVPVEAVSIDTVAEVEKGEDRRFSIPRVRLEVRIALPEGGDADRAVRLLEKAEAACLVTRSIRSEVTVVPRIEVGTRA